MLRVAKRALGFIYLNPSSVQPRSHLRLSKTYRDVEEYYNNLSRQKKTGALVLYGLVTQWDANRGESTSIKFLVLDACELPL